MKPLLLIVIGFGMFTVDTTVTVNRPLFSQTTFLAGDSLRYVAFFDTKNERLYPDDIDYLEGVDSCVVYIVHDVQTSFHPVTVLQDQPNHKIVEAYKRINRFSWMRYKDNLKEIVIEDRSNLVTADTIHKEDPFNPGNITVLITRYYGTKVK